MNLLTELNQKGTTIVVVTHDASVAARTKRTIRMVDGVIVESK
jgi:putative ABC transport system ATP-binding protein